MQFFKHRRTFLSSGSSVMQGAEILLKATVEIVGINHRFRSLSASYWQMSIFYWPVFACSLQFVLHWWIRKSRKKEYHLKGIA